MPQAAVRVCRESVPAVARTVAALGPLHGQLSDAPAAAKGLREREAALLTCHALADELDQKRGDIVSLEQEGSKLRFEPYSPQALDPKVRNPHYNKAEKSKLVQKRGEVRGGSGGLQMGDDSRG